MSTTPDPVPSFVPGKQYRVLRSFKAMRDSFAEGEVLTYERTAYSRYDGITGYFFANPGNEFLRSWDVADDEDHSVWKDLFEEVPAATE